MCLQGSFHARDNINMFLRKCADMGLPKLQLFEPSDLVDRRNDRYIAGWQLCISMGSVFVVLLHTSLSTR